MGVAVFVSLEKEIADVHPLDMDGKLLAKAQDALDEFVSNQGLKTIAEMTSFSDEEIEDFFDEEAEVPQNEELWFSAADGLATIRAMLKHLNENPGFVQRSDDVREDLLSIETILVTAEAHQSRFHFSLDF